MTLLLVNSAIIIAFLVFLILKGSSSSPVNWLDDIKATLLKLMQPGGDRRLFSGFTQATFSWVRNALSWVRIYNWTGTAAGINGLGGVGGGTLITPRHVLFANHVPYPDRPFDIFFVNKEGRTFNYKVISIQQVEKTDIAIGTLDRDADSTLAIYPVLPDNWTDYLPSKRVVQSAMGETFSIIDTRLPVLYSDYEKKISTGDLTQVRMSVSTVVPPEFEPAKAWSEALVIGDSGNPIFVQVGTDLVLLGAWHTGTAGGVIGTFPWLLDYRKEIESITGIRLRTADLSKFNKIA